MDDLPSQLRRHFESQQLPPERVQEILAAGRAAAAKRSARRWWQLAAAAALLIVTGLIGVTSYVNARSWPEPIPTATIAGVVREFFTTPDYQLDRISAHRRELTDWLQEHGGPADFAVPPAMAGLTSYGCEVLDVKGQKVFLICFLLEAPMPPGPDGAMPEKKMMTVTNPDGTMMKKSVPLVHLVVAAKASFSNSPQIGERMIQSAGGEWHFTTWTKGDLLYLAAGAIPREQLQSLVATL